MTARKKLLDYAGPLFIHPLMGGVIFVGNPELNIDGSFVDATLHVRLWIELLDAPDDEDAPPPVEYVKR